MRIGVVGVIVAVCCLVVGCGSSGSGSTGTSADEAGGGGGGSSRASAGSSGGAPEGVKLVGCEQAYDGIDPVAIVEFPPGTEGDGTSVPNAGWAYVEFLGTPAALSVTEEPASVTVYAGSVEPVGSQVFGATPTEVEDPEAVEGCRITSVGTNGSTPQNELEGPSESVEGEVVPYGTEPPEEIQSAYEDSPGAA